MSVQTEAAIRPFTVESPGSELADLRRHVRSKHDNALPLILTHGSPGSIVEFLGTIDGLTDPEAHGGRAEDAFHVVIPSIPGYGFSGRPDTTGWGPEHIARAWVTLMNRLGYQQFVAQGGDWGGLIVDVMGVRAPDGMMGIHTNFPGTIPPNVSKALASNVLGAGDPKPPDCPPRRVVPTTSSVSFSPRASGTHSKRHCTRRLYGLSDPRSALAAWMLDHDRQSYEDISQAFVQKEPVGSLTRDEVLDNVTLTWLTNTGVSSARLYWERAYPNLVYFNEVDTGNHFAAWQEPDLFTTEVRNGFRPLR